MAKRKKSGYGVSNPRSVWPKVPAPKGYVYNVNGVLLNWPYVIKKMEQAYPELLQRIDLEHLKIQEVFIQFCEAYEDDTGFEFELNKLDY